MIRELNPGAREAQPSRPESPYASAFETIASELDHFQQVADLERQEAGRLTSELLRLPRGRRSLLAKNSLKYQTLAICQQLVVESHRQGFEAPAESLALANLALVVAGSLSEARYSQGAVEDLKARCWGQIGNARRILDDFRGADAAFVVAKEHLERGTGDSLERAWLLSLAASLRKDQNRLDESKKLQQESLVLFGEVGDCHLQGRALIKMSSLHTLEGEPEKALACLGMGVSLIDVAVEPQLALFAAENLSWILLDCHRYAEARAALQKARQILSGLSGHEISRIRHRWCEGRIEMATGNDWRAEQAFLVARQGFLRCNRSLQVAEVTLDLALLYARQGRTADMKQLVIEILPVFESRELHDDVMAALLLFRQAVEAERATLSLVEQVRSRLEKLQVEPRQAKSQLDAVSLS